MTFTSSSLMKQNGTISNKLLGEDAKLGDVFTNKLLKDILDYELEDEFLEAHRRELLEELEDVSAAVHGIALAHSDAWALCVMLNSYLAATMMPGCTAKARTPPPAGQQLHRWGVPRANRTNAIIPHCHLCGESGAFSPRNQITHSDPRGDAVSHCTHAVSTAPAAATPPAHTPRVTRQHDPAAPRTGASEPPLLDLQPLPTNDASQPQPAHTRVPHNTKSKPTAPRPSPVRYDSAVSHRATTTLLCTRAVATAPRASARLPAHGTTCAPRPSQTPPPLDTTTLRLFVMLNPSHAATMSPGASRRHPQHTAPHSPGFSGAGASRANESNIAPPPARLQARPAARAHLSRRCERWRARNHQAPRWICRESSLCALALHQLGSRSPSFASA
ncbi:hypothetical protein WOLCODRAFT_153369 [Wolfiporia cocos MD-104 SS10]|uniref:Uncharacterized protein n=1 Tax=Wolfiporia cocos (strain MD-104) TaxID=742152 RepID=A0A2H3JWP2_WOLCO|nr:hypothetical protein WOLCODRAFT_153369 [Wolfiporia cocos MD-104 SS10]